MYSEAQLHTLRMHLQSRGKTPEEIQLFIASRINDPNFPAILANVENILDPAAQEGIKYEIIMESACESDDYMG